MNERMNGWLNIALSLLFILFFFWWGLPLRISLESEYGGRALLKGVVGM